MLVKQRLYDEKYENNYLLQSETKTSVRRGTANNEVAGTFAAYMFPLNSTLIVFEQLQRLRRGPTICL
jgi:hypothetical protein